MKEIRAVTGTVPSLLTSGRRKKMESQIRLPTPDQRTPQYFEVPSNVEAKQITSYFSTILSFSLIARYLKEKSAPQIFPVSASHLQ
jgi:hypothetical protein